jgi:hypothetical protein
MHSTNSQADQAELDVESLTDWLHETHFDGDKTPFFSHTDIERIGEFLLRFLWYRPSKRPSARDNLSDPLFGQYAFGIRQLY